MCVALCRVFIILFPFISQAKKQYDRRALSEGKDDKVKFELLPTEITVTDANKAVSCREETQGMSSREVTE